MKRAQSELGLMLYNSDHPAFIAKNIKSQDDVNKISIRSTQKRRNFPQTTGKRRDNNRKVSDTDTMSYIMALRVDRFRAKRKNRKNTTNLSVNSRKNSPHTRSHAKKHEICHQNTKKYSRHGSFILPPLLRAESTTNRKQTSFFHCFWPPSPNSPRIQERKTSQIPKIASSNGRRQLIASVHPSIHTGIPIHHGGSDWKRTLRR